MADISKEDLRKEIAAILKNADLSSTSAKKVRQELEQKLDADLQSRKKEIDDLVMEFVSSKDKKKKKGDSEEDEELEDEEEEEEEEEEDSEDEKKKKRSSTGKKPVAKKAKKASDESASASEPSEGDSEEEYSPKKSSKPIKTRKLPPKKKKGSESDSDEDWGKKNKGGKKGGGGKRGGSGYTKTMTLSPELAALVGQDSMARHEVVKRVWAIIKERDLYDPKNKQYAICDDALFKVIGVKRFRTFGMMKFLKNHFIS
ncbi:upstream activation factor subunit spp27 [Tribolium madens]|uniref:upstream activation factor subunit spp27 n=1 Tax=Tribolium madens TaxID=41895 RepID=UPI001CF72D72|nr:upstream activation factor subunit spp27 [Tribolium madens]